MPRSVGRVELGPVIGAGGFGKVFLGHDRKRRKDVAVKLIDKHQMRQLEMEDYVSREVDIMKRLRHPHVIQLIEVIELPNSKALVLELAPNGELFDRILESKRFDEGMARKYFQQLMSAVAYCHKKGVVHRDLKAENLLLGEDGSLKVCDFGLSRYTTTQRAFTSEKEKQILFTSLAGSTDYQAPEMILSTNGYEGTLCDVWSAGVILFFMLTGRLPFSGRDDNETEKNITEGKWDKGNRHLTSEARDLINRILVNDPRKRMTMEAIVHHPWFAKDLDMAQLFPDHVFNDAASPVTLRTGSFDKNEQSPKQCDDDHVINADILMTSLTRAFHSCNVSHNGQLKRCEVRDVLIALNDGKTVENDLVDDVMSCFELDPQGTISLENFVQGWTKADKKLGGLLPLGRIVNIFHYDLESALVDDLRRAFDRLDINSNGVLSADNVMAITELKLNPEEATQLIDAMDTHNNHAVTFEDFVRAVTTLDLLRCHPIGTKLQRLSEMFDAVDRRCYQAYVNTGFTVAGLRETIQKKLLTEATQPPCHTEFDDADQCSYLHGTLKDPAGRRLEVGVQLIPAATGYTKVMSYRISGKTETFHQWFSLFRKFLHAEIVRCAEDTSVAGDSELV